MAFFKRSTNGRARRRPQLMLGDQALPTLEPRVVPTVIAGPYINNQYGTVTTFNEVGNNMTATVKNNGTQPVIVTYQSFANATAGPTSAGDHNSGNQVRTGAESTVLLFPLRPGQTVPFALPEGTASRASDGQILATQFDVQVTPANFLGLPTGTTVNTGGIIAYRGSAPAGAAAVSLDFASAPITTSITVDASDDPIWVTPITTAVDGDDS